MPCRPPATLPDGKKAGDGVLVLVEDMHLHIGQDAAEDVKKRRAELEGVIGRLVDTSEHLGPLAVIKVFPQPIKLVVIAVPCRQTYQ